MFLLWSATLGGWLTKSATYHSDPNRAAQFTEADAFEICARHVQNGALGMIPVHLVDVEVLLA